MSLCVPRSSVVIGRGERRTVRVGAREQSKSAKEFLLTATVAQQKEIHRMCRQNLCRTMAAVDQLQQQSVVRTKDKPPCPARLSAFGRRRFPPSRVLRAFLLAHPHLLPPRCEEEGPRSDMRKADVCIHIASLNTNASQKQEIYGATPQKSMETDSQSAVCYLLGIHGLAPALHYRSINNAV